MVVPPTGSFLDHVDRTISVNHMFRRGDSILVGVSGGPDSVALFHVLIAFAPKFAFRLGVAHLNHRLRIPESDRDARFVAALAGSYHAPFYLEKENVQAYAESHRLSIEEAGRRVRYDFFARIANQEGYNKIALGHHVDDNAELLLMYLIRGSGLKGLSGISPVREDRFVRPFIGRTRSEILNFLHVHKIDYVTDTSNTDQRYLRNRIRHHLIPLLQKHYNPKIIHNLNRLSNIIRSDNEWLDRHTHPLTDRCIVKKEKDRITVSISRFSGLEEAVQRRLVRRVISEVKGDLRRITYTHIEAIRHLVHAGPAYGSLDLPDRIRVTRDPQTLVLLRARGALRGMNPETGLAVEKRFEYQIQPSEPVLIREVGRFFSVSVLPPQKIPDFKSAGHYIAFFDMDLLKFPLKLRNYQPGDRFAPLGLGGTQKIKDFFINNKVPRKERINSAVLLCGKKIIWVVGYRIDESVKITPATRQVLKAELFLA